MVEYTVPVPELDEDVWPEILKRLPTESVCRFRCVCKRWNSILSSAFFIDLYFTFNLSATPRNLKPYLRAVRFEDIEFHNLKPYFPFQVEKVGKNTKDFTVIGVTHGVICMVYSLSPTLGNDPERFYLPYAGFSFHWNFLWNPSIHKYVALPRVLVADSLFMAEGFGYDASRDDFKIIMITGRRNEELNKVWLDVFSARQGFWRPPLGEIRVQKIDDKWAWSFDDVKGYFVNGIVYWLATKIRYVVDDDDDDDIVCCILLFDCQTEKVRTMDIPKKSLCLNYKSFLDLFEYAGMLAILVDSHRNSTSMSLWVMEEHGVSTSWKKLYTVNPVYPDLGLNNDGGEGEGEDLDDEGEGEDFWESEDETTPCEIITIDPSFEIEKQVPYGPSNQWYDRCRIMDMHVYNKSLFLMDHPKAQSYTDRDVVHV